MNWKIWIPVLLIILIAGWMLFDGMRALIVGDYVTPKSGAYAGQLGPWSKLVKAISIEPRSTSMKLIFVVYGLAALVIAVCYALGLPWARWGMLTIAILGLCYLPIGTIFNLIVIILLLFDNT